MKTLLFSIHQTAFSMISRKSKSKSIFSCFQNISRTRCCTERGIEIPRVEILRTRAKGGVIRATKLLQLATKSDLYAC